MAKEDHEDLKDISGLSNDAAPLPAVDEPELKPLSIFDLIETDDAASENGRWFTDIFAPGDGISVKLRRLQSKKSANYRSLLMKKYQRYSKGGEYPPEIEERMLIEQMAGCIIVDWNGILDRDGKEIPFSQNAALLLAKHQDFRVPLVQRAMSADNFRVEARKEVEGNS